jgi:hypothetical protein
VRILELLTAFQVAERDASTHARRHCRTLRRPVELPIEGSPSGWVWANQTPVITTDFDFEGRFPAAYDFFKTTGQGSLLILPMTTGRTRLGALGFGNANYVNYDDETIKFLAQVTGLVALTVENSLSKEELAREEEKLESLTAINTRLAAVNERTHNELQQERDRLQTLVEISSSLAGSSLDLQQMFPAMATCLNKSIAHDSAVVNIWRESEQSFEIYSLHPQPIPGMPAGLKIPANAASTSEVLANSDGGIFHRLQIESLSSRYEHLRKPLDAGLVQLVCCCNADLKGADRG